MRCPDEVDGLLALAEECGRTVAQARERIGRVAGALTGWRDAARRNRVGEHEVARMTESIDTRLTAVMKAARI